MQRINVATDQPVVATAGVFSIKLDQTTVGTTNGVSVAQIGANTVLAGNGITGTGSQRVTIASDNTAFGVKITDGVSTAAVKAASTAPIAADPSQVVSLSPNTFGGTIATSLKTQVTDGTNVMPTMDNAGRAGFVQITGGTGNVAATGPNSSAANADRALVVTLSPNTIGTQTATPFTTSITNGTSTAFVTPASTAALATNQALVVSVSPNSTANVNQTQVAGTAIAVNSGVNSAGVQRITLATDDQTATNLNLAQASVTAGQKGNLNLTATTTAAPVYTTATSNPLSTDVGGNLRVLLVSQTATSTTNSTITLGGTAQNIVAANTSRKKFEFYNNSGYTMMISFGITATAIGGIPVNAGSSYVTSNPAISTSLISVFCIQTGATYTYLELN